MGAPVSYPLMSLLTRRSTKPVDLTSPGPSAAQVEQLLTAASRVPDHGKLVPWRFIIFEGDARLEAGESIAAAFRDDHPHAKTEHVDLERARLARAPLVVGCSGPKAFSSIASARSGAPSRSFCSLSAAVAV